MSAILNALKHPFAYSSSQKNHASLRQQLNARGDAQSPLRLRRAKEISTTSPHQICAFEPVTQQNILLSNFDRTLVKCENSPKEPDNDRLYAASLSPCESVSSSYSRTESDPGDTCIEMDRSCNSVSQCKFVTTKDEWKSAEITRNVDDTPELFERILSEIKDMNALSEYQLYCVKSLPEEKMYRIIELYNTVIRNVNEIL